MIVYLLYTESGLSRFTAVGILFSFLVVVQTSSASKEAVGRMALLGAMEAAPLEELLFLSALWGAPR